MTYLYIALILFIIGIIIIWYFHTKNTYIVRVKKNQVMEFKTAMDLAGLPIITFYQGKEKYHFLLDTGCNISYVNASSPIKIEKTGIKDVFMGADGVDRDVEHALVKLYHGKIEYVCNVAIADLDNALTELKNVFGIQLTGFLGNNFFTKYQYCLDFKELVAYERK